MHDIMAKNSETSISRFSEKVGTTTANSAFLALTTSPVPML